MGDNTSLDDFLGGESNEQSEVGDDTEPADAAADAEPADAAADAEPADAAADAGAADGSDADTDVDPAATTYAWSDDGVDCQNCGETVERRWQQDGGLVCIECKDWERA